MQSMTHGLLNASAADGDKIDVLVSISSINSEVCLSIVDHTLIMKTVGRGE